LDGQFSKIANQRGGSMARKLPYRKVKRPMTLDEFAVLKKRMLRKNSRDIPYEYKGKEDLYIGMLEVFCKAGDLMVEDRIED